MIVGVGIDIVSIRRIRRILDKRGDRFIKRFFSPKEAEHHLGKIDPAPSLAANFAAKEALLKSLGKGIGHGLALKDISIERDERGKPFVNILNEDKSLFNDKKIHLSISHEGDVAAAMVIIEE